MMFKMFSSEDSLPPVLNSTLENSTESGGDISIAESSDESDSSNESLSSSSSNDSVGINDSINVSFPSTDDDSDDNWEMTSDDYTD